MFRGHGVAVVVPALDEEATIAEVVREFRSAAPVDLVIVVDNASRDRTAERARQAGALVVHEPRPGYGAALRAGIESAVGGGAGRIVLTEADGSFRAEELERLLAPTDEFALVLGSRTRSMGGPRYLRLGNTAVALAIRLLWPGRCPALSDVGCTYRALTAEAWRALRPEVRSDGPEFSPQMICAACRLGLGLVELPVSYDPRRGGRSKHTGDFRASARTARRMLHAILAERCRRVRAG